MRVREKGQREGEREGGGGGRLKKREASLQRREARHFAEMASALPQTNGRARARTGGAGVEPSKWRELVAQVRPERRLRLGLQPLPYLVTQGAGARPRKWRQLGRASGGSWALKVEGAGHFGMFTAQSTSSPNLCQGKRWGGELGLQMTRTGLGLQMAGAVPCYFAFPGGFWDSRLGHI